MLFLWQQNTFASQIWVCQARGFTFTQTPRETVWQQALLHPTARQGKLQKQGPTDVICPLKKRTEVFRCILYPLVIQRLKTTVLTTANYMQEVELANGLKSSEKNTSAFMCCVLDAVPRALWQKPEPTLLHAPHSFLKRKTQITAFKAVLITHFSNASCDSEGCCMHWWPFSFRGLLISLWSI